MNLNSFPYPCFGCAVLNGMRTQGGGEGLVLHGFGVVGFGKSWPWHHQSWRPKNLEKPFQGKEGTKEIEDPGFYWEAVKNGVTKLAQKVPKCNGKLLQGGSVCH